MKYNININQKELVRISKKARLAHGAILDYIKSLCVSPSEKLERYTHDGRTYTWMDYGHALREMPLLRGKTAASLTPIIQDLESWKLILTVRPENQKVFVAPGLNFERVEAEVDQKAVKQSSLDKLTNNTTKENNISDATSVAVTPFSLEDTLKKWESGSVRRMDILAWYFRKAKFIARTKKELDNLIHRHIRAATRLEVYTDEELVEGWKKSVAIGEKLNFAPTLETVLKQLTQ